MSKMAEAFIQAHGELGEVAPNCHVQSCTILGPPYYEEAQACPGEELSGEKRNIWQALR